MVKIIKERPETVEIHLNDLTKDDWNNAIFGFIGRKDPFKHLIFENGNSDEGIIILHSDMRAVFSRKLNSKYRFAIEAHFRAFELEEIVMFGLRDEALAWLVS